MAPVSSLAPPLWRSARSARLPSRFQELVNLLLLGRAVSNVFDGEKRAGGRDGLLLRGVAPSDAPAPVGFLSLLEAHGHGEVGLTLKRPSAPVWLCYMESHYSLAFAPRPAGAMPSAEQGQTFEVVYYDQLANQDEEIVISVCPRPPPGAPAAEHEYGLVPPLEETLRTLWPKASFDWNGSMPLL